jgi:radical SAM-linked protein
MSERTLTRMRVIFGKKDAVKYISHLDLLRAWERVLRRAGVPLAYSLGFNPHPRIVIAMPLPVGCTGEREVLDMFLDRPLASSELLAMLAPALPAGISVVSAEQVPLKGPALPSVISHAIYEIAVDEIAYEAVEGRVADLLQQEAFEVEFRRKRFDLRPLVGGLTVNRVQDGVTLWATLLRTKSGRIGRPDVLLEALGLTAHARRVHRTEIVFGLR